MSLSSFCVVSNALRLNFIKLGSYKITNNIENELKENETMEKIIKIDGMMCPHCEAAVKKCLEEFAEVESAEVSHQNKTAVLTLNKEISDEVLKKAIEDKGYTVIE